MDQLFKCGYCGFLLNSQCENLLDHECLKKIFIEEEHDLVQDNNKVLTIVKKNLQTVVGLSLSSQTLGRATSGQALSQASFEEQLLKLVQDRPALYNPALPLLDRTTAKKNALWEEISNILGGQYSVEELQKKWKYLRDCYMRAKKKMTAYKPSGSGASSAKGDPGFRYYEAMMFLSDGAHSQSTVCSVQIPTTAAYSEESIQSPPSYISEPGPSTSRISMPPLPSPLMSPDVSNISSRTSTPTQSKKRKRTAIGLEEQVAAALTAPVNLTGLDGFLLRIGESLKRMPYRERSKLEMKILQLVFETEEKLEAEGILKL